MNLLQILSDSPLFFAEVFGIGFAEGLIVSGAAVLINSVVSFARRTFLAG